MTYIEEIREIHLFTVDDNYGLQSNELAEVHSTMSQLPNKFLDDGNIADSIAGLPWRPTTGTKKSSCIVRRGFVALLGRTVNLADAIARVLW
jgi:hypothetical protein